jgi:hypothetical protein
MLVSSWKFLGSAGIILILAYIGVIVLLAVFQRSLIYHPDTNDAGHPKKAGLQHGRVIEVTTRDGLNLEGWFLERDQTDMPVILFFHGNAGHHGWRAHKLEAYYQAGFPVLIAGYRGYGGNPGTPHEQGLYRDGQAYYDWLRRQNKISPEKIIVYGESLGSGVATKIAADNKAAGLILETPFDSLTATAKVHYPYIPFIDLMLRDRFPNDSRITKINMPVLFMIAGQDKMVPPERGRQLYDLAQNPKQLQVFDDATHNGLDVQSIVPYIADFAGKYISR